MKIHPSMACALFLAGSVCGLQAQLRPEQHKCLVDTVRWLGSEGVGYGEAWRLPDRPGTWVMDCSNTTRYLYARVLGIDLPRTASDQYWTLSQQGRITDAPVRTDGSIDTTALLGQLRSGDLLFWEWTYNIKRTPPVSHVMIYLGRTADGTPKMAGSSSASLGETFKRGGVDVYDFDPNASMGGVKDMFGGYKRRARFVGFGRPLQQVQPGPETAGSASIERPQG
ncbi:MAG: NlpC/P60 family protein [Candidatus Methylacidiphilales bacterium]|nr:NlpC/P60 family protein [Candidatus Methylacidiphilales bacterium]